MENFDRPADQHVNVLLQALAAGRVVAYRAFPLHVDPEDALVKAVRASGAALFSLDAKLAEITDQPNAPPAHVLAIREAVNALFVSVQVRIAAARAATTTARATLESDERAFYEPAAVSEVADVLRDIEARAAFHAADPSERDDLWQRMANGELPDLLAALGRFGFGATATRARVVFRALAGEGNPSRVREFAIDRERIEWAESTLTTLSGALDAGSNLTGVQSAVLH